MDNTEQWAVELANEVAVAVIANQSGSITPAALTIQAAFAEREARLREVIAGMLGDLENIEESAALAKHRTLAALKDRTNG